jgi:glycerol uptake facilitator protein
VLVAGIYAIVDNVRNIGPGANLWPLMVGLLVFSIGLSLGGPTGYAINPARDFGPRLYAAVIAGDGAAFSNAYFLVPIIGPFIGGVLGAFFYDLAVKPFLPVKGEVEPEPRGADVAHEPAAGSER